MCKVLGTQTGGRMKRGNDSVIIGNVPAWVEVGDRSVVIGPTDAHGNTIINTPGAIGYGASAEQGSIAIGAFANAGGGQLLFPDAIKAELLELVSLATQRQNAYALMALQQISNELQKQTPAASIIHRAWAGVQALADIEGAQGLLSKAAVALFSYLQSLG